jgi:hypothetical protein
MPEESTNPEPGQAMSQENVDLVRSTLAAWEQGDFSKAEWADPEIGHAMIGGLDTGTATGTPGMAQAWGSWLRAWGNLHVDAEEYRDVDADRVLFRPHHARR